MSAAIRLFIFDNRIEIISPGHLPNNLTVERIRAGISNLRNPILVSYAAKGMLPYHGLGSGITRALEAWPEIDFTDDREGCQFIAKVHRKAAYTPADKAALPESSPKSSPISSPKTDDLIVGILRQNSTATTEDIGIILGRSKRAILKQIDKLKAQGRLRRVGPAKGGHWEVLEEEG